MSLLFLCLLKVSDCADDSKATDHTKCPKQLFFGMDVFSQRSKYLAMRQQSLNLCRVIITAVQNGLRKPIALGIMETEIATAFGTMFKQNKKASNDIGKTAQWKTAQKSDLYCVSKSKRNL